MFKAKGEKHRVARQKKPAQIDPEVAASSDDFVSMMVTPARLEQGLTEAIGGELLMTRMGKFLQWIAADVRKESVAELEAGGLVWKQVGRAVGVAAKTWFSGPGPQRQLVTGTGPAPKPDRASCGPHSRCPFGPCQLRSNQVGRG